MFRLISPFAVHGVSRWRRQNTPATPAAGQPRPLLPADAARGGHSRRGVRGRSVLRALSLLLAVTVPAVVAPGAAQAMQLQSALQDKLDDLTHDLESLEGDKDQLLNDPQVIFDPVAGNYLIGFIDREIDQLDHTIRALTYVLSQAVGGNDPVYGVVQPLGTNPVNGTYITGMGFDGTAVVVAGYGNADDGTLHAIKWTLSGGTVDLGTLPGNPAHDPNATQDVLPGSQAFGISADGAVIVGGSTSPNVISGFTAFRWTAANGMQDLGSLLGVDGKSTAYGADGDGGVIVGKSEVDDPNATLNPTHAFRWVLTPGLTTGVMTDLDPTFAFNESMARAVDLDGGVVIGDAGFQAMRWTAGTGMQQLGVLAGDTTSIANAVSGDGAVIVGTSSPNLDTETDPGGGIGDHAFRWTAATGMADLTTLLSDAGVDMTGVSLVGATAVTSDGQFIAGNAVFPDTDADATDAFLIRYCDATVAAACQATYDAQGGGSGPVGGMTTEASVEQSFGQLAGEQNAVPAQLGGTADLLLGGLQPIEGDGYGQVFGAVGSFTLGARARTDAHNGFSLLGGMALLDQSADGASAGGPLFGAAVRYVAPVPLGALGIRPFAEAGGWAAPDLSLHFSRSYANGSGTATAEDDTDGSAFAFFGRAGVLVAPTPADELAFSATLARDWLNVDAFAETLSSENPFPASFGAAQATGSQFKATAQWTHTLAGNLDLTLSASAGRSFGGTNAVSGAVDGFGTLTGTTGDYAFGQLGASLAWNFTDTVRAQGFVLSTFGDTIGTHTQFGGALSVAF